MDGITWGSPGARTPENSWLAKPSPEIASQNVRKVKLTLIAGDSLLAQRLIFPLKLHLGSDSDGTGLVEDRSADTAGKSLGRRRRLRKRYQRKPTQQQAGRKPDDRKPGHSDPKTTAPHGYPIGMIFRHASKLLQLSYAS